MNAVLPSILEQLFLGARTHGHWLDRPVSRETLERIYELARWGPTSMNAQPGRFVFLTGEESKERLRPALMQGNLEKTMTAPVTVIVASDRRFYEHLPRLFPAYDARPMFEANPALAQDTAYRNSTLQGAYLIMAARALGLDAGPMSGFDADKVNAEFFPDGRYQVNFLINLGYGDQARLYPRNPRLELGEAAQFL